MVPKHVFAAVVGTILLAWSGTSIAAGSGEYQPDEYQAEEFLGLDLSKAVLSPKPLGPATKFAPVRIQAKSDPASPAASTRAKSKTVSEAAVPKAAIPKAAPPKAKIAHLGLKKPHSAGRTKLARRHGNPLDAQAFDTRIQVWPCRSGGICNWQRH